ncbi:hypothetical protein C8R44DRAFT_754204 [Mycena epipterygia]|nr:hypothetical protein C8R44DRAFT_754204 [Mycena epipterygia]
MSESMPHMGSIVLNPIVNTRGGARQIQYPLCSRPRGQEWIQGATVSPYCQWSACPRTDTISRVLPLDLLSKILSARLPRHTYIDLPPFCEVQREEWDSRQWNSANLSLISLISLTSLNNQEWDSDSGASNNFYLNSAAARVRETMGEKFHLAARSRAMSPTLGQPWQQKEADEV